MCLCSAHPSPALLRQRFTLFSSFIVIIILFTCLSSAAAWRPYPNTTATLTAASTAASSADPNHLFGPSKKYEGSSDLVHLRYHMGPILSESPITVHVIWYGNWLPRQKRIIRDFISSISPTKTKTKTRTRTRTGTETETETETETKTKTKNHARPPPSPSVSGWWRTVQLYTDQTGANISKTVHLGSEKSDRHYSFGKSLTRLSVQSVIKSAITASTRPLPVTPRSGLYLVLTSADVYVQDFCGQVCGFHYFTFPSIVGYTLPYAWVGNSERLCPGICAYPFAVPDFIPGLKPLKSPNGDAGVDGMVSVIGHEIAEAVTNPLVNAWYAGPDPVAPVEIADLCEGIYGTGGGGSYTGQLITAPDGATYNMNGVRRRFLVQWIWNHVVSYCTGPNALDHS